MINGEDYNVLPLSISQEIVKVKAVNRVSSGISRYFDLKDVTGKYSQTNLFGTDGVIYKEPIIDSFSFSYVTRSEIESILVNELQTILSSRKTKDFYIDNFPGINQGPSYSSFYMVSSATNMSTGYFGDTVTDPTIETVGVKKLGSFTSSNLRYLVPGSLVRFIPKPGYVFSKDNKLIPEAEATASSKPYLWTKIVQVAGDGSAASTGVLSNGQGPVILNDYIPSEARLNATIPKFVTSLEDSVRARLVDLIIANKTFGLRYDVSTTSWKIVTDSNLDKRSPFSLGRTGDLTNQQLDASWVILFETNGETYTVSSRGTRFVFESEKEIRFFYDGADKVYDSVNNAIIRDKIVVLDINTIPDGATPIGFDVDWEIVEEYKGADGYIDTKKISISFYDSDEDGVIDNPELFNEIVLGKSETIDMTTKYIFQKRQVTYDGVIDYYYIDNSAELIKVFNTDEEAKTTLGALGASSDQQLVFIINDSTVKTFYYSVMSLIPTLEYRGFIGRDKLKFQYLHAADESSRLDPAATNIIDVYMLTRSYDTEYRQWLKGEVANKPLPPSSDALYINFGSQLNKVKAISDEVIYHSVKYKNLFGSKAETSLQATFKVVKSPGLVISDNDIKTGVIDAITEFFTIENWEFGDTFYFGELATYIMRAMSPKIANIVIVPKSQQLSFGSLYEIKSNSDEIFSSSATVDDVEIISEITATRINASGVVLTTASGNNTGIVSQ